MSKPDSQCFCKDTRYTYTGWLSLARVTHRDIYCFCYIFSLPCAGSNLYSQFGSFVIIIVHYHQLQRVNHERIGF